MGRAPKLLRGLLFSVAGLGGIALLALAAVWAFVDINDYKPRVEAAASAALGMSVAIEGAIGIGIVPQLHVNLQNVRIRNHDSEIAWIKEAELAIALLPLLHQEIHYTTVATKGARISIERGRDGRYNYQKPAGVSQAFHVLNLPRVSFADLIVAYKDLQSTNAFDFTGCDGELTDLRHPGDAPLLKRLSLSGKFTCAEVRGKNPAVTDLRFSLEANDGVFDFKPVTMSVFAGNGSGTLRVDRSAAIPAYRVDYALKKFRIDQYFKAPPSGKSVSGTMDFSTTLTMRGITRQEMRQSANGTMSLTGANLTLTGVNLDAELARFESSQNFNLIDLGAILFAGPVGLAVSKGVELSSLAQRSEGSTPIRAVVSHWKVEKGVAYAKDVALATSANRLAVHGGLNFINDEYQDVTVALIDAKGCATVTQKVSGSFKKPTMDTSVHLIPVRPLLKLLDQAKKARAGTVQFSDYST